MNIIACGLNHKTAPLSVREQFAPTPTQQHQLLNDLVTQKVVTEAVLLNTCNRTELYCTSDHIHPTLSQLTDYLPFPTQQHTYVHHGRHALRHMLRVACGIDSMLIGEPQIFGQMKQAYRDAQTAGAVGHQMTQLFQRIFATSKQIRSQTALNNQPVSIAYLAAKLVKQTYPDLEKIRCLLVGTGETITLVARYLQQLGIHHFVVAGRSAETAQALAQLMTGQNICTSDIQHYLAQVDVVISATSCPLPFISYHMVEDAIQHANHLLLLDLAVPRDIEPSVGQLANTTLYNIDDLQHLVCNHKQERQQAAHSAEQLIDQALVDYQDWQRMRQATDVIHNYRRKIQNIGQQELQRALQQYEQGADPKILLSQLQHRILQKYLHAPTIRIKEAAVKNQQDMLQTAQQLFQLED